MKRYMNSFKEIIKKYIDCRVIAYMSVEQNKNVRSVFTKGDLPIFGYHGAIISTNNMTEQEKFDHAIWWSYHERAQIALTIAQFFPGGDYLEFGSEGMGTFRSFLSAFDLQGANKLYPETRFLAFDIFGKLDTKNLTVNEKEYFKGWTGNRKLKEAHTWIEQHNLFVDRCEIHSGLFRDTLPPLLERYQGETKVGCAFLDCNITESYSYIFTILPSIIHSYGYVYMDEYYINQDVPSLFRDFLHTLKTKNGVQGAEFIRNSGGAGALFRLTGDNTTLRPANCYGGSVASV